MDKVWQHTIQSVAQELQSDRSLGISDQEAVRRLSQYGPNVLEAKKPIPLIVLFLRQFASPLVWVLLIAAILAFLFKEWLEGSAVLGVILINALIGFFMEWQANRSMDALQKLAQSNCRVIRNGVSKSIKSKDLVPGDLVVLEAGDVIPADCRVISESNLGVKEAALTGESTQVGKYTEVLAGEVLLADRENLLFKGTIVSRGNASAMVYATGTHTELGRISQLAQDAQKEATPLEKKLGVLSQKLLGLTLVLVLIIMGVGIFQGKDFYLMIKTAIALGIAAIPEGLPIVATIALARGMLRLARHQVIVKKLSAVESLGQTQIIFTDKTGTLTENSLSTDTLLFDFGNISIRFDEDSMEFENPADKFVQETFAFEQLQKVAALCNNARVADKETKSSEVGDPLEVALLKMVNQCGFVDTDLREEFPRIKEIPFDSDTKMMGTLHRNGKRPDFLVCIKGALEVVLPECDFVLTKSGRKPFEQLDTWLKKGDELSAKGLRLLAFAYSEVAEPEDQFFHNLTLIGCIGFLDPPRSDIKAAIQTCKTAGVRVIMVTGDHPETARTIAFKTGLVESADAMTFRGEQLPDVTHQTEDSQQKILETNIFARVSPAQKLNLVSMYQKESFIVGMTGDGINDAPALKKADIGIAMGKRGTEAAKEVADLILEDDAFTSIVLAIKQGRGIFQNIRYFVVYLLSCNLSEILIVAMAALANFATPLMPLQILFLNMVTDVFPALALGMNKEGDKVMQIPPRDSREPIINRGMWRSIVVYSICMTIGVMAVMFYAVFVLEASDNLTNNLTFYTLILVQLWHVLNLTGIHESFFKNEVTRNTFIWLALAICVLITFVAYQIPLLREVLNLQLIEWDVLWIIIPFSFIPVILIQLLKRLKIIT